MLQGQLLSTLGWRELPLNGESVGAVAFHASHAPFPREPLAHRRLAGPELAPMTCTRRATRSVSRRGEPRPSRVHYLDPDDRPPAEVTRDLYLAWRTTRAGHLDPELMTNPVWAWLAGDDPRGYHR
jgi:hypothetical protein